MKHLIFIKILLIFFVFGCGLNALESVHELYTLKPKHHIRRLLYNAFVATILGIAICMMH